MTTMTSLPLHRVANALDRCSNTTEARILGPEPRARIFAAIDDPSIEHWIDARSILIAPGMTLWQAVIAAGLQAKDVPTDLQIIIAIERTHQP